MAWTERPSEKQIGALYNLVRWVVSLEEFKKRELYLSVAATKREMSEELGRVRELKLGRKLTKDNAFQGKIWKDYK